MKHQGKKELGKINVEKCLKKRFTEKFLKINHSIKDKFKVI
jgi:hypothetical protein